MMGKKIGALTGSIAALTALSVGLLPPAAYAEPSGQPAASTRAESPVTDSSYAYSVVIGGVEYVGSAVRATLPTGTKPSETIRVKQTRTDQHADGSTSTSSSETEIQGRIVDSSVNRENDINVRTHRGTASYEGNLGGQAYSAQFGYEYGESNDYHLVVNGKDVPFTRQSDGSWGIADADKPVLALNNGTTNQLAAGQRISISNNGNMESVTPGNWGTPTFDAFSLVNTFQISGAVEGTSWSAQMKATRPVEHTGKVTDEDRSVRVDGKDVPLSKIDGAWKVTVPSVQSNPAKTLEVRAVHHRLYENGKWKQEEDTVTTYQIAAGIRNDKASYPQFGVRQHDGTQQYTGKNDGDTIDTRVVVDYSYTDGAKLQLKQGKSDSVTLSPKESPATEGTVWSTDGETPVTFNLTGSNTIEDSATLTFTDGTGPSKTVYVKDTKVSYGNKQIVKVDDALIVRITGTVSGVLPTDGGEFAYKIPYIADRTYNDTVKALRVTETASNGTTTTYDQTLEAAKTTGSNQYEYSLPRLSYDHMANRFAIAGVEAGADAAITTSPAQRNENGSLTFTVLVRSPHYENAYQVTIPFAQAPVVVDANAAHLADITVNGTSIRDVNGDGFDPDRLSYTVKATENDKVYILPVASPGVFISAGDVTQSAGSSTYRWVVSQSGKNATTYSVTVLRLRDWKTADEEFTPKQPVRQEGTETAGENDTDLQSHGYVGSDGKYVTMDADKYNIPEGGVFSYQAKTGQVALVTTTKVKGMTYRYTVNIAAPGDLANFVQHVFTVTYITPVTQRASLTGIKVNGHDVPNFNPDVRRYTVEVPRTDQWTLVPQYDEKTGMSVDTHKNGNEATITATSADGLVKVSYEVHVIASPASAHTDGTTGILAQAGSGVLLPVLGAIMFAVFSLCTMISTRLLRRT